MRKRFLFREMCRLAVLTEGHVQARVLAFKKVSMVTTGIRLIHCPGLFHIYAATGHGLGIAATESRTVFQIREAVSDLHVAVAGGSGAHFVRLRHTVVHPVIQVQCLLYIYTSSAGASAGPLLHGAAHVLREHASIPMKREMNKHRQPSNLVRLPPEWHRCAKTLLQRCIFELSCCSTAVRADLEL